MSVPSQCLWCGSAEVKKILWGLPAKTPGPEWFVGGCVIPSGPLPQFGCGECGRTWSHLGLKIRAGEVIGTPNGPVRATRNDLTWVRQIRACILQTAADLQSIDGAELKKRVEFPHDLDELPRLMALVVEDCLRRGQPRLASLAKTVTDRDAYPDDIKSYGPGHLQYFMPNDEVEALLQEAYSPAR